MQKISKILIGLMAGLLVAVVGLGFASAKESPEVFHKTENVVTTSTSLKTNSSIFKEITTDGLASYLEIKIPEAPSSIKSIKIIQTIGSTSNVLTKDETEKTCYYQNSAENNKNTTFHFTRPATYTVIYIHGQNNTRVQESCTFKPELNDEIINKLYTTKNAGVTKNVLTQTTDKLLLTSSGNITLPQNSIGLYTISASTEKQTKTELLTEIPDNTFGKLTYTITSVNGNCYLTLDIYVLTINFAIDFSDIEKSNYEYLGGYVFNKGVDAIITIPNTTTNLKGNQLSTQEKLTAFSFLKFSLNEFQRNGTNTANGNAINTPLETPTTDPVLYLSLSERDHSIFKVKTAVKNAKNNLIYENSLPPVKVITKVPVNANGQTVFSIIPTQGSNYTESNYLTGILNGYIKDGTVIYYPTNTVQVFNNGDSIQNSFIAYNFNSTTGKITTSQSMDFLRIYAIDGESNIQLTNDTISFDQFYTFSFTTKSYKVSNTEFDKYMLYNRMFYNTTNYITDDFSDSFNTLNFPIQSFTYKVPADYETNGIPTFMRVTFNGTTYDDIHTLENNDSISLTTCGDYVVEFYNLPSYDYITKNIPNWNATNGSASIRYYYKLEFTITGPAIKATTLDYNNKELTVSNNMYTQKEVECDISLNEGQSFVVYLNGNEYARRTESMTFNLSSIGTWKIAILNQDGVEIHKLSFTIVDTIYQGFTINEQVEYLSLVVSKRITSMPITYQELDHATAYHLTQSGVYKIDIDAKENLVFKLNGNNAYAYTLNSNSFVINITKSYFNFSFATGKNGDRISEDVVVSNVDGVQLQKLEVYRNDKFVKEFDADDLSNWAEVVELSKTFSDNGTYTFRMTDKFGNTYETQIEKYYKVNVALIFLILIILAFIVIVIVTIIKARHKVNVK